MKKILALFITAIFIASNCFGADINDWIKGDGTDAVEGVDSISDLDTLLTNYIQDPLDRLLTNYRAGCQLAYTSATTVTIQPGEIVCSNSGGTIRRMRKNTSTTTIDLTKTSQIGGTDDTGAEAANATYYVYAVADADATTFTAVCSTSASAPTGSYCTYYRYIGSFANVAGDISSASVTGVGAGRVVQVVNTQTGAVATGTTAMQFIDTIPPKTEGDEYMTLAITPKSATNKLIIEVVANVGCSNGGQVTAALFQDTTTNSLAASDTWCVSGNTINLKFTHYMISGTTSATTFKVRIGTNNGGTLTFNGAGGGRKYGGVMASSITISEYES